MISILIDNVNLVESARKEHYVKTIKLRIIAIITMCTILLAAVIGYVSINESSNMANNNAKEYMQLTCMNKSAEINSLIERIEQSVDTLSAIVLSKLEIAQFKSNSAYVSAFTQDLFLDVVEFANNTEGAITAYIRYNPDFTEPTSGIFLSRNSVEESFESLTPTDFSAFDKDDLEHVGWYYIPVNNKQATWMDPYLNANINTYMISYVVPLYVNGESVGIIGMDIDFSKIIDITEQSVDYKDGYCFLINASGEIMHHKELELGEQLAEVEDGKLAEVTASILESGNEGKLLSYQYQGKAKNLVYATLNNGMKFILSVPKTAIQEDATKLTQEIAGIIVVFLIIVIVIGFFLGTNLARPIKRLTEVINQTAQLNFGDNTELVKLAKRDDETGKMAKSVMEMRSILQTVLGNMVTVKESILTNVTQLDKVMKEYYVIAEDNSTTTEELASGMQETASNTEAIAARLETTKNYSQDIAVLTKEGLEEAGSTLDRALELKKNATASSEVANTIYADIAIKAKSAMDDSKAVYKISELTEEIKGISAQTNLLALNASIEAARAGDAGRGFAVVASEIGNLASETLRTLDGINSIVSEITKSVTNLSSCMDVTMNFLQSNVVGDYEMFVHVSEQYENDANTFRRVMSKTDDSVGKMFLDIKEIANIVEVINTTISQSSEGVYIIAEKSSDAVMKTQEGYEYLEQNKVSATQLEEIINKFQY